jgi:hypothetical protein
LEVAQMAHDIGLLMLTFCAQGSRLRGLMKPLDLCGVHGITTLGYSEMEHGRITLKVLRNSLGFTEAEAMRYVILFMN